MSPAQILSCFRLIFSPSSAAEAMRFMCTIVEYNYKDAEGKSRKTNLEVDFVASDGNRKYYIQSALTVGEEEKRLQEVRPYSRISDSFTKIVVVKDRIMP